MEEVVSAEQRSSMLAEFSFGRFKRRMIVGVVQVGVSNELKSQDDEVAVELHRFWSQVFISSSSNSFEDENR